MTAFAVNGDSWSLTGDAGGTGATEAQQGDIENIIASMNVAYDDKMWAKAEQDKTCAASQASLPQWPVPLLRPESSKAASPNVRGDGDPSTGPCAAIDGGAASGAAKGGKRKGRTVRFADERASGTRVSKPAGARAASAKSGLLLEGEADAEGPPDDQLPRRRQRYRGDSREDRGGEPPRTAHPPRWRRR